MNKRNAERREAKVTARKRNATRDLAARKGREVVGGLLPAVKPSRQVDRRALFDNTPMDEVVFS